MRHLVALALFIAPFSALAGAREPLGVFGGWGVFRDARPHRCYAIAEPEEQAGRDAARRPFAAFALWPGRPGGPQLHVRLRKDRKRQTPVNLWIGPDRFALVAGIADAWASDPRADAAITRAARSGEWMRITARDADGHPFSDSYALKGAATAIDSATLGCARRR